jgi:hypothetical protein
MACHLLMMGGNPSWGNKIARIVINKWEQNTMNGRMEWPDSQSNLCDNPSVVANEVE